MDCIKIISHRGNLTGPGSAKFGENNPLSIEHAIREGFDVEVDVQVQFYCGYGATYDVLFGHDPGKGYISSPEFIRHNGRHLWLHLKNTMAIEYMRDNNLDILNCFMHDQDMATYTSGGDVWACPDWKTNTIIRNSVVMLDKERPRKRIHKDLYKAILNGAVGICTDYPLRWRCYIQDELIKR